MGVTLGTYGATGASGWTVFTASGTPQYGYNTGPPASGNTMVIYVSDTGSDGTSTTEGSSANPYLTIAKGLTRLRNGQPDWLLLKKANIWNEAASVATSGKSLTEPMVIGSYDPSNPTVVNPSTGGARPIINTPAALNNEGIYAAGTDGDYLALVGIEFYSSDRDPSNTSTISPFYSGSTSTLDRSGIKFLQQFHWALIEDCKVSFFGHNVTIESNLNPGAAANLIFRRNVTVDAYLTGSLSSGAFIARINNPTIEENLFDHNGWNATVPGANDPAWLIYSHNLYVAGYIPNHAQGGTSNPNDLSIVTARGNIFTNDAAGVHFRSGGTVDNNLFSYNPSGFDFGAPVPGNNFISNNVFLTALNVPAVVPGWGFGTLGSPYEGDIYTVGIVNFVGNILANAPGSTEGLFLWDAGYSNKATFSNNIVFGWGRPIDLSGATGIVLTDNNLDEFGTNNNPGGLAPSEPFPFPTRSIGSYNVILGGANTLTAFLASARLQAKSNWNPDLTANAVNIYIRAGFNITSPGINIFPSILSDGTVGVSYSQTISATGGTGSYTFSVVAGTLPTGLSLSSVGVLNGTPTVANTFTFTVQATDTLGATGTLPYMITMTTSTIRFTDLRMRLHS